MTARESLTFVVGEERHLRELLSDADVLPLLNALVAAGAASARVVDDRGEELWGAGAPGGGLLAAFPVMVEGEEVARVEVRGEPGRCGELSACAGMLRVSLDTALRNSLKRLLTTELHAGVVQCSYEELLRSNAELAASEARYRELAAALELRVEERSAELQRAHAHLLQQEKMAAVGQLAAGVAHEINNPLGFITSNLHTLQKYVSRFCTMLEFYRERLKPGPPTETVAAEAERKWRELKLPHVVADAPELVSQSICGAERVSRVVADLKGFSHVDEKGDAQVDLNLELERTLGVLTHALKGRAEVVRELEPLPALTCAPQLPGQIFLNLIMNAVTHGGERPRITVRSSFDGKRIRIGIADDGPGVPPPLRGQIFEPFFTTLPVGSGTGMGLAVVYDAVTTLGGTVAVAEAPGGGAEFVVAIPAGKD